MLSRHERSQCISSSPSLQSRRGLETRLHSTTTQENAASSSFNIHKPTPPISLHSPMQLLEESESVSGFVRDLTHFVDQLEAGGSVCAPLPPVDYYAKITSHLAMVGWRK